MGPPSSGALTVAQTLKLVERFDLGQRSRRGAQSAQPCIMSRRRPNSPLPIATGTSRTPDFISRAEAVCSMRTIISPSRSKLIRPDVVRCQNAKRWLVNHPAQLQASFGRDATRESVGTSHISIIDGEGNAVSMTTTIESAFGSGVWAAGFLLNNELTDFSFHPDGSRQAVRLPIGWRRVNDRAARWHRRSFSTPHGNVKAVLGSPGGSRIILYVIKAVVGRGRLGHGCAVGRVDAQLREPRFRLRDRVR